MASALVTLILLAYSSMLTNLFGIEIWQIIVLAIGVAIMLCAMQALTMMIYSLTNGKKKLIQITLAIVFACVLALLAIYVIEFFANGADINSAISSLSSPYLEYVPMIGWMKGAVFWLSVRQLSRSRYLYCSIYSCYRCSHCYFCSKRFRFL